MSKNIKRKYWIITDTHFGHENIHKFCERPIGFEEKIFKHLKRDVGENDILIHLGDVAWFDESYWHQKIMEIPCFRKWLVKGNHDRKSNSWYLDKGWDFVGKTLSLDMYKKKVIFSHIPLIGITANNQDWDYNIHGHFHNLGVDRIIEHEYHIFKHLNHKHILLKMEHHYKPYNLERVLVDVRDDYTSEYYTFNKV